VYYKYKLLNHVSKMEDITCQKQLFDYRSMGRRSTPGRFKKGY